MRYMLQTYVADRPEPGSSPAAADAFEAMMRFNAACRERGVLVASDPLATPDAATTVRVGGDGATLTTDGPFAETKEWLGGYFVVECDNLDDALELAAECPASRWGTVEVRPVVQREGARGGELDGPRRFMLLIHDTPDGMGDVPADSLDEVRAEYLAVARAPGVTGGAQLEPASTATTVRVRDERTLVTDGPFAETKEQLGGYYVFGDDDRDAAIALAARIPAARFGGAVEVRPVLGR